MLRDRRVSRWLLGVPYPLTLSQEREWLARTRLKHRRGQALSLWAIERSSGRLVGGVSLHEIHREHRRGEAGYWLGVRHWGHGYASEMLEGLLELAFGPLALERVEAGTFPGNDRSAHVLEKAGFRLEGRLRGAIVKDGVARDDLVFGLLKREWQRARKTRTRT